MRYDPDDDDKDTSRARYRRSEIVARARGAAPRKQSYETSEDVQRWLRLQAEQADGVRSPFDPQLLAGRRDHDWVVSSLARFYDRGLIADVVLVASSGKEATVYCCTPGAAGGDQLLAAKVYRPRMFRSLRNDAIYRTSRVQVDVDGRVLRDARRQVGTGSARGRAAQVEAWIRFEYETQLALYQAGADVPRPLAQVGNAVLMSYIGDQHGPAPRLQDVTLHRDQARAVFDRLLANIMLWLQHDRIHGDLSSYNILWHAGQAVVIDFAQAVDPRHNPEVYPLLARDVARVCAYAARYGVHADAEAIAADLWARYLLSEL